MRKLTTAAAAATGTLVARAWLVALAAAAATARP